MSRAIKWGIVLWLLLVSVPSAPGQPYNPFTPGNNQQDPRIRRALRERAIAYAGNNSRPFIEKFGDEAVTAVSACTQAGARKLVEFSASEGFDKIPKPGELLRCIGQRGHGDDVVLWLVQPEHARLLSDIDNQDAFMSSPLEIVYSLKTIEQAGAENRARRLAVQAAASPQFVQIPLDNRTFAWAGGGLFVILLLLWKRRRSVGM